MNYLDGSLFDTLRQFVPARAKVKTGAIIKSHKLHRSKVAQVSGSIIDEQYTSSISVSTITGSQGGVYESSGSFNYTTNYTQSIVTPLGRTNKNITDESIQFNGELSGSAVVATDGEIGIQNPFVC